MPKTGTTRYFVTLGEGGQPEPLEITQIGERELQVGWRNQTWTVDALELGEGSLSLLTGVRSYSLEVEPAGGKLKITAGDSNELVSVLDERSYRMQSATSGHAAEGRQTVSAPMPGKVVRVLVSPGDEVGAGQGLVVVEAMKMENELKSPKAGKVSEVSVKEGDTVEGGAALVIVG